MENPLSQIRIVLVEPHYPANVGAAARAMKTMGLRQLWLVRPREFPHPEARRLATEAADVLDEARVVDRLEEALQGVVLTMATSSRKRSVSWPTLDIQDAAGRLVEAAAQGPVALLFGPEPSGLTSADIYRSQAQAIIPTADDCRSLNLAQAVQVAAYEIHRQVQPHPEVTRTDHRASHTELEHFYETLRSAVISSGFPRRDPDHLMLNMRKLFGRAELSNREVSMLEGLLRSLTEASDE